MTFETDVKASCWQILLLDFLLLVLLHPLLTGVSKAIRVALQGNEDAKILKVAPPPLPFGGVADKIRYLRNAKPM